MTPLLYIIVPCYNEEEVLPITAPAFLAELQELTEKGKIAPDSRVLFVDDGSRDGTWEIISGLAKQDPRVLGIRQSRNRGHQNAVLAGLMEARDRADITISIDCDGQDEIGAMERMVDAWASGSEIVYGVRSSRKTDSFFKRFTAESFYRLLNGLGGQVVFNHADYRLVSARVLKEFANYHEVNLFLRGLFPLVGFNSSAVYYERHERLAGKTHYPLRKMLGLAVDGITSLSTKPLGLLFLLGLIGCLLGFAAGVAAIVLVCVGSTFAGWLGLAALIVFCAGIQTLGLGVVGEYVGKTYMEVKARPRYIISERTWEETDKE